MSNTNIFNQSNENETEKGQTNSIIKETNFSTDALFWYQFGFKVIPILPGSKKPATMRDPWFQNLGVGKIHAHWASNPDHEVGCILGSDLIVFETNNPEYEHALAIDEENFGLKPKLVVKTSKGVQHYFRCAPGIMLSSTHPLWFTDRIPVGVYVKTSGDLVILPGGRGQSISLLEAKSTDDLSVVDQEFIDEIYQLNGMVSPSALGRQDKLKPCASDYEIQFGEFWVTVKLDCDDPGVHCDDCPVRPGFINLQQIRW
jgi:hypothetical protein